MINADERMGWWWWEASTNYRVWQTGRRPRAQICCMYKEWIKYE